MKPEVNSIYVAERGGADMQAIDTAILEQGRGIVGDRYHSGAGKFFKKLKKEGGDDWQVTLIEAEEIDAFLNSGNTDLAWGDFRRNIVTTDVRLNDLVGHRFRVGVVVLEGVRLCEPCGYLSKLLKHKLVPVMNGRCGLRARIIAGGPIAVGDTIQTSIS